MGEKKERNQDCEKIGANGVFRKCGEECGEHVRKFDDVRLMRNDGAPLGVSAIVEYTGVLFISEVIALPGVSGGRPVDQNQVCAGCQVRAQGKQGVRVYQREQQHEFTIMRRTHMSRTSSSITKSRRSSTPRGRGTSTIQKIAVLTSE